MADAATTVGGRSADKNREYALLDLLHKSASCPIMRKRMMGKIHGLQND